MAFSRGIGYYTRVAHKALSRKLAGALAAQGVAFKHYFYLRALFEEDGITQMELSGRTGMERATVTRVLDTMESEGLVRREHDPQDRRKMNVYLTAQSRALREPVRRTVERLNREALRGIDPAELETFYNVLQRITANAGEL